MAPSKFVPDPLFFGDPDGICGLAMAKSAGFSFGSDVPLELIPLVVSGRPPAPSKGKLQFGHHVTRSISKHHGAHPLFYCAKADLLNAQLEKETIAWNPAALATPEFPLDRLDLLRSKPIGGILAVFSHFDESTQTFGTPVLRVVACPAVATLGTFSVQDPPGFNLQEAWDPTASPLSEFPSTEYSCPIMVSSGGFTRHTWPYTVQGFLTDSRPLFIPSGEHAAGTVTVSGTTTLRTFFLPSHAHIPIGMAWKLDGHLTPDLIEKSIRALTPKTGIGATTYDPFLFILAGLAPSLTPWLLAVQADPVPFALQAFPFSTVQAHFPDLTTGAFPPTITCSTTFAPLMDLRYLYSWRLMLDKLLSSILDADIAYMLVFLARIETCLHADTYMGTKLPAAMSPNIYYHFKSHGGWPTGTAPHADFERDELISSVAQAYEKIPIEVHEDRPAPLATCRLITTAAASAQRHQATTPKYSTEPTDNLAKPFQPPPGAARPGATPGDALPPVIDLFASPPKPRRSAPLPATPSGPNLFVPSGAVYSPPGPSSTRSAGPQLLSPVLIPTAPKWPELLQWSIADTKSRNACAPEFLLLSYLLIHGPSSVDINSELASRSSDDSYTLLVRPPGELFRLRVLLPLFTGTPTGTIDSAKAFLQGLIDQNGEGFFTSYFTHLFFQAPTLKSLLLVSSWNMDEGFDPLLSDNTSFNIYSFLPSLRSQAHLPPLLPADGLRILAVKQLAQFILAWFRGMDISFGLDRSAFDLSILGTRLIYLTRLLDRHQVHHLWENGAQKAMTFVWLANVRSLLHLYQRLVTSSVWKRDAGFLATSPVTLDPFNRDQQHFLDLLRTFDSAVQHQWRSGRLLSPQSFYDIALLPPSHFTRVTRPPTLSLGPAATTTSTTRNESAQAQRARASAETRVSDFVATQPLFAFVTRPPSNRGGVASRFLQVNPQGHPMPKLQLEGLNGQPGTFSLICFPSSVSAPHNRCCTAECLRGQKDRKRQRVNRRSDHTQDIQPFCHVDLSKPYFANQPEAYWQSVVTWLRLPGVSASILPSQYLKAKTPFTPW